MNMSLYKKFKDFCSEIEVEVPLQCIKDFILEHSLLIIMFMFYHWKMFSNAYPSTSIEIDLAGITPFMVFEELRKHYQMHPNGLLQHELPVTSSYKAIWTALRNDNANIKRHNKSIMI